MVMLAIIVWCIVEAVSYCIHGLYWHAIVMLMPPILWTYLVEAKLNRLERERRQP